MRSKITNEALLTEVIRCWETGKLSDELARMFQLMVEQNIRKKGYHQLTYDADIQAHAMVVLCKTWERFNPDKFDNAFAYFTTAIHCAFTGYLGKEVREEQIKKELAKKVDEDNDFW